MEEKSWSRIDSKNLSAVQLEKNPVFSLWSSGFGSVNLWDEMLDFFIRR